MDSLYLVMPAYNEEENIEAVVRAWYPILDGKDEASRLVIADSGSTDGTHRILESLQAEFPQLEILSDTGKQHGPKVIALYDYAIKNEADYIFQTDSDGQTNPAEFERFWNLRSRYAGIFGFRNQRGDGKIRAFVEMVVCFLLNLYFHVSVPDANAPFRLMRTETVKKYLHRMDPDYNLPNIMMTTFFAYYGEPMRFRKITFRPRQAGVNSVNIPKIIKIGWKALGDFRAFKKDMRKREAEPELSDPLEEYPDLLDDIPDMPKTPHPYAAYQEAVAAEALADGEPETSDAPSDVEAKPETSADGEAAANEDAKPEAAAETRSNDEPDAPSGEEADAAETKTDAEPETPDGEADAEPETSGGEAKES